MIGIGAIMASGQGLNDGYFGLFTDVHNPEIDCNAGSRDVMMVQRCMTRDFINNNPSDRTRGVDLTTYTYMKPDNTSGLYGKVARGVASQRPKRNGSSAKSSGSRGVGSYNYNTSDAHIRWQRDRQAQINAAREKAAHEKKMRELQKKIADDNRAAAVTAQTNAALQAQTDARIQRDRWHASEGAALAQQRARQALVVQGPQFDKMKPQSTGTQQASRLRGANKPRRVMATGNNTARKPMPAVQRSHSLSQQQREELRQAIRNRMEKQRQLRLAVAGKQKVAPKKTPAAYYDNNGRLVLDKHAHSSLGKDWHSESFTPLPAPPPVTRVRRKMTQQEYHNLIVIEMIDRRPMTQAEKNHYDNLTI